MTYPPTAIICFERPDSDEARSLIQQLDEDLLRRYPAQAIHGLHPHHVTDPDLTFLIARLGSRAVGCGAIRDLEPGVGEVKRMFVQPEVRGRGIARQILVALESKARELGYSALRLETGTRQPEGIGLYKAVGYCEIPCFSEYADNPFSVCFEKRLV
jgi:putative acetyltransferase